MIKVDYHVPIGRDPMAVYDYVTDVERIPEWQHVAGVKKVTEESPRPARGRQRILDGATGAARAGRRSAPK